MLPMIVAATLIVACAQGQSAFQTVQLCAGSEQGVAALKNVMMTVAQTEGLQFIDNSAQQGANLKAMGADKALKRDADSAIDFHIEGPGGMGVTAGNLGLLPYQVGLGFTEGSDPAKAHQLADKLIRALSERWEVLRVPPEEGIAPMQTCEA